MLSKLSQIFKAFSKTERWIYAASFLIFLVAFIVFFINFIQTNTVLSPVDGGTYTEGVVGQPIFINPVFSENNNPDSDIVKLVFADLKNISDNYQISNDKKTFNIRIKGNIFWQDNQPLTADDVIFTIKAIQDPDVNSPLYQSWKEVKAERVSEREIKIILPNSYVYFENIMLNLRPIPKHIFGGVPFANLKLSNYNLEPVGSGPFKFSAVGKRRDGFITEIALDKNKEYFGPKPYLNKFYFKFYSNEEDLIKAFNSGDINGFSLIETKKMSEINIPHQIARIKMPRYYAVFLNPYNNPLLKDGSLRLALNLATDKQKITKSVFGENAFVIKGPLIFSDTNYGGAEEFAPDKAKEILESNEWHLNNDGVREKKDKAASSKLEFTLSVYPNPFLTETAKIIQEEWFEIGVKININVGSLADFSEEIIKPRNYEMLLFGNIYGENLDPFSFWHSSQKFHPGLNLSLYENKNADFLIELIKSDFNQEKRHEELKTLQSIITKDQPAIFLYSPFYVYISDKSLKGFIEDYLPLQSDRLNNIQNWYVKTARKIK